MEEGQKNIRLSEKQLPKDNESVMTHYLTAAFTLETEHALSCSSVYAACSV